MKKTHTPKPSEQDNFISISEAARRVLDELSKRLSEQASGR